jgi:hypothetical protein
MNWNRKIIVHQRPKLYPQLKSNLFLRNQIIKKCLILIQFLITRISAKIEKISIKDNSKSNKRKLDDSGTVDVKVEAQKPSNDEKEVNTKEDDNSNKRFQPDEESEDWRYFHQLNKFSYFFIVRISI